MPTYAIGDIHGCSAALQTLLAAVPFRPDDTLVTLGDYVDRGPGSRDVLDLLMQWRRRLRLVTLMGNHEIMMLQARANPSAFVSWRACGGMATLASFGTRELRRVPAEYWSFLQTCRPFHETEHHFYVHANAHPARPLSAQPDEILYWERLGSQAAHRSGKIMICGHTEQPSGVPLDLGHAIGIDTYAHGGGWLTCLEPEGRHYWQANQQGEVRVRQLNSPSVVS